MQKELAGVEKLVSRLEQLKEENKRFSRETVYSVVRQMVVEIPYASQIMPISMGENLYSDAPQEQTNLELNETVLNLGKALFDPHQKNEIATLVATYLNNRKKTEKKYADTLLNDVLKDSLKAFPERAHASLKNLAHTILEKIINEKQLRTIPGYRLQPIIEITDPFIRERLFDIELDRVKSSHRLAFKKFVTQIAHDGYDIVTDDRQFETIEHEKTEAFIAFKNSITEKVPKAILLTEWQNKIAYLQKDRNMRFYDLHNKLDQFLKYLNPKKPLGLLYQQLRIRFVDKLRRTLNFLDRNPEIYQSEETIKKSHEDAYNEIANDTDAIKNLIAIYLSLQKNYNKNLFRWIFGRTNFKIVRALVVDTLVGKPISASMRAGGYPQKNVIDLYTSLAVHLKNTGEELNGYFAKRMRMEIDRAVTELNNASKQITIGKPIIEEKVPIIEPKFLVPTPEETKFEKVVTKKKIEKKIPAKQPAKPPAKQPAKPPITPPPLKIEVEFEPEVPPPAKAPEPVKMEPKPLEIKVEFEPEIPEPIKAPVEPAKVEPKPLEIKEEFEPEIPALAPAMQTAIDSGLNIMKNYQLGALESPVKQAWETMVKTASQSATAVSEDAIAMQSDNEVRLYVICDLAQQISAIQESHLSDDQKAILQKVKTQVLDALKNPLDEKNWDVFEGTQRAYIDGSLGAL